jgi:hypothetical protein
MTRTNQREHQTRVNPPRGEEDHAPCELSLDEMSLVVGSAAASTAAQRAASQVRAVMDDAAKQDEKIRRLADGGVSHADAGEKQARDPHLHDPSDGLNDKRHAAGDADSDVRVKDPHHPSDALNDKKHAAEDVESDRRAKQPRDPSDALLGKSAADAPSNAKQARASVSRK